MRKMKWTILLPLVGMILLATVAAQQIHTHEYFSGPIFSTFPAWFGLRPTTEKAWIFLGDRAAPGPAGTAYGFYDDDADRISHFGTVEATSVTTPTLSSDTDLLVTSVGDETDIRVFSEYGGDVTLETNSTGSVHLKTAATGSIDLNGPTEVTGGFKWNCTTAPPVACSAGKLGTTYCDSDIGKLCFCNGTNYVLQNDDTTTTGCS